ncbi:hypothetical protein D1646_11940 [Pseudoflavonifractor sp. 60]|uniref:hypothetical protein n=1 Tax=Pseudoflavonifractor sp. 60 TaxID=2304576 RepID=UPI00136B64CC|nr:hypothetical protein [Pseudoflavonifractor sp. 60]NBI67507.1 hypothetical protein [Pseudoflavonifractor sp. 60]
MSVSGVSAGGYWQNPAASGRGTAEVDGEALAAALRERRESQPSLPEMMKEVQQRADERERMLKKTKNPSRYGDAPMMAYSKLARARTAGEVDAASGYARRQIARLRAAKGSDSENADRIQAAINQLQKAVNRAGRKKRELSQEKTAAARQARLEKEERIREAKRQRQELRRRQAQRVIREAGYLREAEIDNRQQSQLAASKLELRNQMQQLSAAVQPTLEAAIQGYAATEAAVSEAASTPEVSVEA